MALRAEAAKNKLFFFQFILEKKGPQRPFFLDQNRPVWFIGSGYWHGMPDENGNGNGRKDEAAARRGTKQGAELILIAVLTVLRVDGAEAGGNGRHQHRQGQQQRRRRRDTPPRGLLHPAANHADGGRRDARWSTLFCLR